MYIDMKKSAHISPSLFWGGLTCFSNQLYCIVKIISMITLISLVSTDNHISANLPLWQYLIDKNILSQNWTTSLLLFVCYLVLIHLIIFLAHCTYLAYDIFTNSLKPSSHLLHSLHNSHLHFCDLTIKGLNACTEYNVLGSSFLVPKWATGNCNQLNWSRKLDRPQLNWVGPVLIGSVALKNWS